MFKNNETIKDLLKFAKREINYTGEFINNFEMGIPEINKVDVSEKDLSAGVFSNLYTIVVEVACTTYMSIDNMIHLIFDYGDVEKFLNNNADIKSFIDSQKDEIIDAFLQISLDYTGLSDSYQIRHYMNNLSDAIRINQIKIEERDKNAKIIIYFESGGEIYA